MLLTEHRANRIVLDNISWQKFESLLLDLGESLAARVAYDRGTLEIMTPLPEHEYYKEIISDIIKDTSEVLELDYACYGSTTWKRELRGAGIEPDNCFYFQNEAIIRGKLQFDLNQDPPPDLALEIDLTSKSLDRFPIYARLEVPEIWCYDAGEMRIYHLQGEGYLAKDTSSVFPDLKISEIPSLIERHWPVGRRVFRGVVREWVREQIRT
jgi:Uma2 family endonuclease